MLVLIAVVLLIFVLSPAVGIAVLVIALLLEIAEIAIWRRWMRHRRVQTGSEAMQGEIAEVLEPCSADRGTVRLRGETWAARSETPIGVGQRVRIASVDGLTLRVEPAGSGTEKGP